MTLSKGAASSKSPPLMFRDDFAAFRRLDYWAQWDHLVAFAARTGNQSALGAIVLHAVVFLAHALAFQQLNTWTLLSPALDDTAWHRAALKNTIVWTLLTNYFGLALGYVGPLYGEVGWRLTARRFQLGVVVRRGVLGRRLALPPHRQWYDVIFAVALCALCVLLLGCGDAVPACAVWALALLSLLAWALLDVGAWLGCYGMQYHWPMAWLLQAYAVPTFVALPCMQLWLLAVYFGCAVAKIGPWWALGNANEWTSPPPFAGNLALSRLFYRDAHSGGDYRTTAFATLAAHATSAVEGGAPLLILLGACTSYTRLGQCGLALLFAMHAYIVTHCAHADVYNLNWLTAHCLYYCFVHHTKVNISSASTIALALLALDLLYAVWGQCSNAHRALQSYSYKYWSGNYSHALYFFSPSGKAKLDAKIADPDSALHKLGPCGADNAGPQGWGLVSETKVAWGLVRAVGMMWYSQLDLRLLPFIVCRHWQMQRQRLGRIEKALSLTESFAAIYHNLMLHQWLMGQVSHEVCWHDDVLAHLQRECCFQEGELTCVVVYAFGSLSHMRADESAAEPLHGCGRWLVKDAAQGLVLEGRQSSCAMAERIRRPSDLAALHEQHTNTIYTQKQKHK